MLYVHMLLNASFLYVLNKGREGGVSANVPVNACWAELETMPVSFLN